jgi:predicted permease
VRGFLVWNPFGALPARSIAVNFPVLSLAAGLTVLAGLLFGAWPAFNAVRLDVNHALRGSTSGASASADKLRARSVIVMTQIALSVVLLIGASLMLTTFLRVNSEPLGFNPADTHVVTLSLPHRRYASEAQITQLADRVSQRLRTLPGVEAAGMTLYLSLTEAGTEPFVIEDTGETNSERLPRAVPVTIGPGYLQAMGVATLDGRDLTESDQKNTLPVVLINEEAVERYFGGKSPIGTHIRLGDPKDSKTQNNRWLEVVGVVAGTKSTRYNQITWQARPEVYTDYRQQQTQLYPENSDYTTMFFVIRTRPGVALSLANLQKAVWSEDPNLPVERVQSLSEMVSGLQTQPRVRARLLGLFAGLTLLLAAIGIYGVMAQSVAQRNREIGVRIALGADHQNVLLLILKRGLGLTLAGVFLGTSVGLVAVRFLKSLLYGVAPNNPWVYLLVAGMVSLTALLATFFPAKRAASVNPITALRTE